MAGRSRTLRKLSGIHPDTPEFDLLVQKSQVYKQALAEAVELREMLRKAHSTIIQLRENVRLLNNILLQLKLAALDVKLNEQKEQLTDVEKQKLEEVIQAEIQRVEAGPEERPVTLEAKH